jgi:opacity protein-like surface antigen
MKKAILAVVAAAALALPAAPAQAVQKHNCRPFPGPGDNIIHMSRFQVRGIGCSKAKHVVRAGFRCGECHVFRAKHREWRTNMGFPGQHWIGGKHKRIWIEWID